MKIKMAQTIARVHTHTHTHTHTHSFKGIKVDYNITNVNKKKDNL